MIVVAGRVFAQNEIVNKHRSDFHRPHSFCVAVRGVAQLEPHSVSGFTQSWVFIIQGSLRFLYFLSTLSACSTVSAQSVCADGAAVCRFSHNHRLRC